MWRHIVAALLVGLWVTPAWSQARLFKRNALRNETFYCSWIIADGAFVDGVDDASSCNNFSPSGVLRIFTDFAANYNIAHNRDLIIEDWGVIILNTLGASSECNLELTTGATPTAAGTIVSTLTTGVEATEAECTEGAAFTVNATNEMCTISGVNTTVAGGGFWRVGWTDNGGGANVCTAWVLGTIWVRGHFVRP